MTENLPDEELTIVGEEPEVPNDSLAPEAFDPKTTIQLRQHFKVCCYTPNAHLTDASRGSAHLTELLEQKKIVAIASDVAGRTPMTFLGRELLGKGFGEDEPLVRARFLDYLRS